MIIKSHVRGGFTAAAAYLGATGANECVRLVEFNDHGARTLNEAFSNMWAMARTTRATKPLHHVSINPHKDERLTDAQVMHICARLEEKYGYAPGQHQRVIVEHVKDGRQHFHVMWNRVNLETGRPVWPGHHWNKSRQSAREIEAEFGLKRPVARRAARASKRTSRKKAAAGTTPRRVTARIGHALHGTRPPELLIPEPATVRHTTRDPFAELPAPQRPMPMRPQRWHRHGPPPLLALTSSEDADDKARRAVLNWAWANGRWDVLALYGIYAPFDL